MSFAAHIEVVVDGVGKDFTRVIGCCFRITLVVDTAVDRKGEFAKLRHGEEVAPIAVGVPRKVGRNGVAAGFGLGLGHDVEYAANALGIVLCAGVGDDFHFLHHAGWKTLEDDARVVAHHLVGLTVDVDFEARFAVHLYVVLPVDGDEGHFAQHVDHRALLRIGVVGHGVGQAVNLARHDGACGGDGGGLQHFGIFANEDGTHVVLPRF